MRFRKNHVAANLDRLHTISFYQLKGCLKGKIIVVMKKKNQTRNSIFRFKRGPFVR